MKSPLMLALIVSSLPAVAHAQSLKATYITDEEVKTVLKNAPPAIDQQLVSVDIGKLNEAVGIIHRGPTGAARGATPAPASPGARGAAPAPPAPAPVPCGDSVVPPPPDGVPGGISHDHQTETYIVVSGAGTLVTGGRIVNGRQSAPDSPVTKVLNGPSCSGMISGPDVVKRVVKAGDIVIIPAGVPHGWSDIADHVDYLSVRPDPDRVLPAGYVNPAIKKP